MTALPIANPMRTPELLARLQRHYVAPSEPLPGGVFLPEVTLTDASRRRVDALYVGFTSSRGHLLTGHELKVTRADWLHELDQPHKAEAWAPQCHAWVVVAPDTQVVRPEELPHGWGLMVPNTRSKTRMDTVVKPLVYAERCPDWVTMHSILKRMDTLRAQAMLDHAQKVRQDAAEKVEAEVARRVGVEQRGGTDTNDAVVQRLRAHVAAIQKALGMTVADPGARPWGNEVTVEGLERGQARYLRADRDVERALDKLQQRLQAAAGQLDYHTRDVADGLAALQRARELADARDATGGQGQAR